MSIDFDLIRKKIVEKRDDIQKMDRERQRLLDQIAAYEELLPAETKNPEQPKPRIFVKLRGLSEDSRKFLGAFMHRNSFGFDDAVAEAEKLGMNVTKDALRPRMHSYVVRGYVARLEDGVFQLTKKGIEAANGK